MLAAVRRRGQGQFGSFCDSVGALPNCSHDLRGAYGAAERCFGSKAAEDIEGFFA